MRRGLPGVNVRKEGIQLFLAGCAGILRPLTELHYAPYPQLVSYGVAADNRSSVQAYSDWLAMFMAGAVLEMGRTWWPSLQREDDRHRWEYAAGVVWFNSIILLDDVENSILRGLKFLDAWNVTGTTDAPVLRDEWENDWRDITR